MQNKYINRFPNIKPLSHKDFFARQMSICMDLKKNAFDFVPPQFHYPKERD